LAGTNGHGFYGSGKTRKRKMKRLLILILVFPLAVASCELPFPLFYWWDKITAPYPVENLSLEEGSRMSKLGWAVYDYDADQVREDLEEGYDPNKSYNEGRWTGSTPLHIIAESFYDTFTHEQFGQDIPNPPPDVAMIQLLVEAGADINQRPYIWDRIYRYNDIESILRRRSFIKTDVFPQTEEERERLLLIQNTGYAKRFVEDSNRVLEAFLKAGADPDMRGHSVPFSGYSIAGHMTDERAAKYFARGTRPVNEAIKKGMRWESQVDLLLQYTTLDKDSLKAARQSKDKAMVQKIKKLWKEQEARK
jgi:hypothetical protein